MRDAYAMFAPYKHRRKVSIFGSARTSTDDPLYDLTAALARTLAERGWMTVTGAGPGIMQAGMEGAGRENVDRRLDPTAVRDRAPTRSSPATTSTSA